MKMLILTIILVIAPSATTNCALTQPHCPIWIWDNVVGPQLSKSELVELLGPPDFVGTFANEYYNGPLWQYYDMTVDCEDDGAVYNQNFLFENGRVSYDWVQSMRRVNVFLPFISA